MAESQTAGGGRAGGASSTRAARPARPRDTRRALLDAGWTVFGRLRWGDLLRSVTVREVAAEAGVTSGAFVHHFPTTERFHSAMALDASEQMLAVARQVLGGLDDLEPDRDGAGALRGVIKEGFGVDLLVARRGEVAMWAVSPDPTSGTGRILAEYRAELSAEVRRRAEVLLDSLDREPLPPFTVEELIAVVTALVDGLRIREMLGDQDGLRPDLVVDTITAVAAALSRPRSATDHLDTLVAALQPEPGSDGADPPDDAHALWDRVVRAAAALAEVDRTQPLDLAAVAAAAEVPLATVEELFGAAPALAAATFARHLPLLRTLADAPLATGDAPERRVEQVATALARLAGEEPAAADAFLEAVVHGRVGSDDPAATAAAARIRDDAEPASLVAPHLRGLAAAGRLRPGVAPDAVAGALVELVLRQAVARPDRPEQVAADACALLLHGVLAR